MWCRSRSRAMRRCAAVPAGRISDVAAVSSEIRSTGCRHPRRGVFTRSSRVSWRSRTLQPLWTDPVRSSDAPSVRLGAVGPSLAGERGLLWVVRCIHQDLPIYTVDNVKVVATSSGGSAGERTSAPVRLVTYPLLGEAPADRPRPSASCPSRSFAAAPPALFRPTTSSSAFECAAELCKDFWMWVRTVFGLITSRSADLLVVEPFGRH